MKGVWLTRNGWIAIVPIQRVQELPPLPSANPKDRLQIVRHWEGDVYATNCTGVVVKGRWDSDGNHYLQDTQLDLMKRKKPTEHWTILEKLGLSRYNAVVEEFMA